MGLPDSPRFRKLVFEYCCAHLQTPPQRQIAKAMMVSASVVNHTLQGLVDDGLLVPESTGRGCNYHVAEKRGRQAS